MGAFNKVSKDAIDNIQINAGVLLNTFNFDSVSAPTDDDIICATTGGITATCTPTFEDFGADIDNCPNNTLELKKITGWECTLAFTALNVDEKMIAMSLGAAGTVGSEVHPKNELIPAYFTTVYFVSERTDNKVIVIKLENALSTGGFSYKTQKNAKGQLTITLTGHVSIDDQNSIPMKFYIADISNVPKAFSFENTDDSDE